MRFFLRLIQFDEWKAGLSQELIDELSKHLDHRGLLPKKYEEVAALEAAGADEEAILAKVGRWRG